MKRIGYTLVEVMIVVAVLAVLGGIIGTVISQARDAAESVDVRARLTESARTAMAEIVRDLTETSAGSVTVDDSYNPPRVQYFTDPLNGETHQVLIFASARGNPADAAEDGMHANNDYVHIDADYKASWRSVIVYCTYVTPEGIQQLRKYVRYGNYSFPFSVSVSADAITLSGGPVIARNSGIYTVRANYITSEVTGPANNNDGEIDNGADLTIITPPGTLMKIKLFLSKLELPTKGGTRRLTATLTDSVVMRNK